MCSGACYRELRGGEVGQAAIPLPQWRATSGRLPTLGVGDWRSRMGHTLGGGGSDYDGGGNGAERGLAQRDDREGDCPVIC